MPSSPLNGFCHLCEVVCNSDFGLELHLIDCLFALLKKIVSLQPLQSDRDVGAIAYQNASVN